MLDELKQRLKQCCALTANVEDVLHLLLTARACTAQTKDISKNLDNYANWYKMNIVEIKFIINADEFQKFIHLLEQCIVYEQESNSYLLVRRLLNCSPNI